MDVLAPVKAFDRFQQRHKLVGIPIAVLKKFSDDQAGNKAALIAYYAFFSIFPLLLLFVTILGFVLHGDPGAQKAVLNSALKQFPIIGTSVKTHSLSGNGIGLAVGIVGSLLSGLGITMAAQNAFNTVYAVPFKLSAGPTSSPPACAGSSSWSSSVSCSWSRPWPRAW